MLETSDIDEFLSASLRRLRTGRHSLWPDTPDWQTERASDAVWERLDFHGVALLFNEHRNKLGQWPGELLSRIAEEARLMALWEATHRAAMAKLIESLAKAGIESVLMKGTAIAYSLYPEPAARRRGDSDLLIRKADLRQARIVLAKDGWYRAKDPYGLTHQEGWLHDSAGAFVHSLDLHWEPSDRPALQRVLNCDDIFASRRPLPALSPSAQRADTVLTIVHEALNQKWHEVRGYWSGDQKIMGARRLIWSVDFDLMAKSLEAGDWDRLVAACSQRGVGPLVADALRSAARDLGTELPQTPLAALADQTEDPTIAAYSRARDDFEEFWLNLSNAPGWGARLRLLIDRGLPSAEHLRAKYPRQASWPVLLLQGRMIIEVMGRVLRRTVTR